MEIRRSRGHDLVESTWFVLLAPCVLVDGRRALTSMRQSGYVTHVRLAATLAKLTNNRLSERLSYQAAEVVAAIIAVEDGVLIVAQVTAHRHAALLHLLLACRLSNVWNCKAHTRRSEAEGVPESGSQRVVKRSPGISNRHF